ncbi:MAG: hypothetical protein A2X12_12030 [Bacteroidetes bacterium GWE2_29_8]|nr:MAG: hypothetical protein A2X12_12030 [Bacteroidetes bacterium GWE2_29_8]
MQIQLLKDYFKNKTKNHLKIELFLFNLNNELLKKMKMKKIFLLVVLISLGCSEVYSQIIFKEDFQNGMPSNFKVINKDTLKPHADVNYITDAWMIASNSEKAEGDSVAISTSYYSPAGRSNDWLITPAIEINAFAQLSWMAKAVDPAYPDGYIVLLSTNGDSLQNFKDTLFMVSAEQSTWTKRQVDLTKYINKTVNIAFVNNSNDMFLLLLDDITVYKKPLHDANIVSISNLGYGNCGLSTEEEIKIKITNFGYDTIRQIVASYLVNGIAINNEIANININPNDTVEYTFTTKADLSKIGHFKMSAYINVVTDSNQTNDTLSDLLSSNYWDLDSLAYKMNFEPEYDFEMNIMEQGDFNNDEKMWILYKEDNYANSGSYFIGYNYNTPLDVNDYLFTRCFNLKSNDIYEFSFWYSSLNFGTNPILKNLFIMLGSGKDSAELMTDTLFKITEINAMNGYSKVSFRFSVDKDSIYYLGFLTKGLKSVDNEYLFIDDIMLKKLDNNDIAIVSHNNQTNGCMMTDTNYISVNIRNTGIDTISNFIITGKVKDKIFSIDTVNIEIMPDSIITYQLVKPADLSYSGIQEVKIWANLTDDIFNEDDTISFNFFNSNNDIINNEYGYSFDNKIISESWSFFDNNNDTATWSIDNGINIDEETDGVLKCTTSLTKKSDDWAFSPCMYLEGGKYYELSFDCKSGFWLFWGFNIPYTSSLKVYIGTGANKSGMNDTALFSINNYTHTSYLKATKVFYVANSGTYYFGFYGNSSANNGSQFIDNVKVNVLTQADVVLNDIVNPYSDCGLGSSQSVSIEILNRGNDTLKKFIANYSLNGITNTDTVNAKIPPMSFYTYTFIKRANLATSNVKYTFDFWVKCDNDNNVNNDSIKNHIVYNLSHDFDSQGSYNVGFENGEILDGWSVYDSNNDGYGWGLYTTKTHEGDYAVNVTVNPSATSNDWLISKCLYLRSTKTYNVSFWYAALDSLKEENLLIYYGTSPEPSKMTKIGDVIKFKNKSFNYYGVTFIPPASKYYYIGLKANSVAGKAGFIIDDITIKKVNCDAAEINPIITGITNINKGDTTVLSVGFGYDKYLWSNKSLDTSIKVSTPGEYFVTVTDSCGNTAVASIGVYYTGINDYENIESFINVYPSPSNDYINIESKSYNIKSMKILNMLGKTEKELYNINSFTTIYILDLSEGIYFLNIITNENQTTTKKIVIQR